MTNSTLPTANEDWGFFGTTAGFTDAHKAWEIASPAIAKVTMGSAENTGNKRGHGSAGSTGLKMGQSC